MAETYIPSGDNSLLTDTVSQRKIGWLEHFLGPENYRMMTGLLKTPASILGFSLILLFALTAIFAPLIIPPATTRSPYMMPRDGFASQPKAMGSDWKLNAPATVPGWVKLVTGQDHWTHILGTSEGGYDVLYGIVWGVRTAFETGLIVVALSFLIGIIIGSISAYYGGVVDMVIMRIVDIFLTMPFLLAALILSAILTPKIGSNILGPMIALIVFNWMGYARVIRGDILSIKERDYVMAARVIGVRDSQILFKHIVPNAIFPVMIMASLDIGNIVLTFAALSFLGIGAPVGYADWGQILSFARDWITQLGTYWYIVVWPGLALILFVMGWNLLGDAVRDVLDPRMRGSI